VRSTRMMWDQQERAPEGLTNTLAVRAEAALPIQISAMLQEWGEGLSEGGGAGGREEQPVLKDSQRHVSRRSG